MAGRGGFERVVDEGAAGRVFVRTWPDRDEALQVLRLGRRLVWDEHARTDDDVWDRRFVGVPMVHDPLVAWWHRARGRHDLADEDAPDGWAGIMTVATGLGLLVVDDPAFHGDFFVRYVIERDRRFMDELGLMIEVLEERYGVPVHLRRRFVVTQYAADPARRSLSVNGRAQTRADLASVYSRVRRRLRRPEPASPPMTIDMDIDAAPDGAVTMAFRASP